MIDTQKHLTAVQFHLKKFIKDHGVTIKQIAQETGVSQGYIYYILNGRTKNPRLDTVRNLVKKLGLNFELFLKDTPN